MAEEINHWLKSTAAKQDFWPQALTADDLNHDNHK